MAGFSPATVLGAIGTGATRPITFAGAMLAGMVIYRFTLGMRGGRGAYVAYYNRALSRRARRAAEKKTPADGD